jgi:hypothetical protein
MERVCILSLANRGGEIAGVIDQHTSGDPDGQQARSHALADIAYCRGDVAECLRQLEKVGSDTARFQAAVIAGKLEEARQAIAHPTSGPAGVRDNREHLVLALAASLAGNSSLSQSELATGIDSLRANGREERTAASWLAGEAEPKPGEPTELALTPELKALILPLVAQRWPDRRDECLALARKLNFDRRFPHLLIARAVGVK